MKLSADRSEGVAAQSACRQARAATVERTQAVTMFTLSLTLQAQSFAANSVHTQCWCSGRCIRFLCIDTGRIGPGCVDANNAGCPRTGQRRPTHNCARTRTNLARCGEECGTSSGRGAVRAPVAGGACPCQAGRLDIRCAESRCAHFGQLQEVGDTKSMTFLWVFPIAGFNEYKNTEDAPRDGFLRVALLIDFHD